LLLTGCLGTQHLKENQKRLIQQGIKAPVYINEEALRDLYAQRPNRRFLGLPFYHLVAMYYWGENHYDREKYVKKKEAIEKKFDAKIAQTTSQRKINNYQFRKQKKIDRLNSFIENGNQRMQWGEQIAVFDTALVDITIKRFKNYLFSEGYFQNKVTTKVTTIGKIVSLSYHIETGAPYFIDTLIYRIGDSAVYKIIRKADNESFIKVHERYREDNISKERERFDLLLKDNGYYDFSRQYVDFPMDTAMRGDKRIAVMIEILDPAKRGYHKKFTLDSVKFITDGGEVNPGFQRHVRTYRDVQYYYYQNNYNLKILSQRVFLTPDNLFSRTQTFNTQRQLSNLDAFKFVNINYDTSGGKFIARIFTPPLKRYEWTNEIGMSVTQGFPGPFYGIIFKKRNIFKGLENFELNGRFGIEGVAAATENENIYKSTQAGVNASLIFPQFIWPLREATQIRFGKYNPKTRLSTGYSYTKRPEYTRAALNLSNTYTWQNQRATQYSLALTNVSLIRSTVSRDFQQILDQLANLGNYALVRTFMPSFVSSMIFGVIWNRHYNGTDKNYVSIRSQLESGGTSLNFIDPNFITRQGLQYFKYLRFNFDYRRGKVLNKWVTLAYHVNTGLAYSYDSTSLPYEKFYFAGGSNSVRAWRPRRLGVGALPPELSDNPTKDGRYSYTNEKPGEFLLEGSVELRSKLVGFIDGAVFIDVGNVWRLKRQIGEIGTTLDDFQFSTFYKQFGVGTGFGLRFDFTFLILRFDVGIKMYDPTLPPEDRFVLMKARFFKPYATQHGEPPNYIYSNYKEPVIYNVGIGFPF
jgi:outer membrane protein insertion porin family